MSKWIERWIESKTTGINYDAMSGWSKEDYEDETRILKSIIREFLQFDSEKYRDVIDFGCGLGRFCDMFEGYIGVDIIPEMIEENKIKYPDCRWLYIKENEYLPYYKYDLVFCFTSIQHLSDDELITFLDNCIGTRNIFIGESIPTDYDKLGEGEYNRSSRYIELILKAYGYEIKKTGTLKSREEYYFIWANLGAKSSA